MTKQQFDYIMNLWILGRPSGKELANLMAINPSSPNLRNRVRRTNKYRDLKRSRIKVRQMLAESKS